MGEIGISRREFLYELKFWEARRIIKGYRRRGKIYMQLLAENVYASTFAMRSAEGKTVADLFPSLFNDDDDYEPPMSEEDQQELLDLMADINAQNAKSSEK